MNAGKVELGLLGLPYLLFRVLRSLLTHIVLYGMLLVIGPVVILFLLFARRRFPTRAAFIWSILTNAVAGIEVDIDGRYHLGRDTTQVIIANHQSNFDVHALILALNPFYYRFVTKKEFGWLPIFGWALWLSGFPMVDRSDNEQAVKAMKKLEERLKKEKMKVVIFPEGTRNKKPGLMPFKKGAFILAINLQADIVPVIIEGARDVQKQHGFFINPGKITVRFLPPISTVGLGYEDREALMYRAFKEMYEALPENEKPPAPESDDAFRPVT